MTSSETKELCLALMKADSEDAVVGLLKDARLWDEEEAWRCYGDMPRNFSEIGAQQSEWAPALVEKIVNAIDARLMNECLVRGMDPRGPNAPKSIRRAVARFFEDNPGGVNAGLVSEWPNSKRKEIGECITITATGARSPGYPSISVADSGEGQTPDMVPVTFLSLPAVKGSNKKGIEFVQGRFNMGGSGVLRFCGRHNLQFILSRRNPALVGNTPAIPADQLWGFTVVRRESHGKESSVYTYLAPLEAAENPGERSILRFSADSMPIFPRGSEPYGRRSEWGSLIKLYEYECKGSKTHMLRRDGILGRMELLLPELALPVRFYECRSFRGHSGSNATNLNGLRVRLEDDRQKNIEPAFAVPPSEVMTVEGERMTTRLYVFRKGVEETYKKNEGIIFTINGQTHGHLTDDFLGRKAVGHSYLRSSILVVVDCSELSGRAREDLFMNSRDRLSKNEIRYKIEKELQDLLRRNSELRRLRERRRAEELDARLEDSKPLADMLTTMINRSPNLSALFLRGHRISDPFRTVDVDDDNKPYEGKRYPTRFHFEDKDYGHVLARDAHLGQRARIAFDTDACNDYFSRSVDRGMLTLSIENGNGKQTVRTYTLNLLNGVATLSIELPQECRREQVLKYLSQVTDPSRIEPFENKFELTVKPERTSKGKPSGKRTKPPSSKKGNKRNAPSKVQLPHVTRVYAKPKEGQRGWGDMTPTPFDKYSALRIKHAGTSGENAEDDGDGRDVYDFYVNVDNIYLRQELKHTKAEERVVQERYVYGMVLLGLALLYQEASSKKEGERAPNGEGESSDGRPSIEDVIEEVSKAASLVILPMIKELGSLEMESLEPVSNLAGEDT